MTDLFSRALENVDQLQEDVLGPNYNYTKQIKTPQEMGMNSKGDIRTISNNISGLVGYTQLLVTGSGKASKTGGPLGDKFFLETGGKCKDKASGDLVTRSIYVDNVPDGSIPFITQGLNGAKFSTFKGLIPGTMSNLSKINPFKMFQAFVAGSNPQCRAVSLPTVDDNNRKKIETRYVTDLDIKEIDPCGFSSKRNPVTQEKCVARKGGRDARKGGRDARKGRRAGRKKKRAGRRAGRKKKRAGRGAGRKKKRAGRKKKRAGRRAGRKKKRRGRRGRRDGFQSIQSNEVFSDDEEDWTSDDEEDWTSGDEGDWMSDDEGDWTSDDEGDWTSDDEGDWTSDVHTDGAMPDKITTIIYYNALGLLGLYILFKLYEKKREIFGFSKIHR